MLRLVRMLRRHVPPTVLAAPLVAPLAVLLVARPAGAQSRESETGRFEPVRLPRYEIGLDAGYARPRGAFAQNIRDGWGGSLHGVVYTSPGSPLGLRVDGQWIVYGNESRIYPFATYLPGGYRLRETTSNNIFALSIGPQFAINGGPFRPYVNVHGGFSYFSTSSSFDAEDVTPGYSPYVPSGDTFSDDWKLSYGGTVGVAIPLTRGNRPPMLDFGVMYSVNGRTTYLTKGDVQRDPESGAVTLNPRTSDAHYITYRLGIAVALP